MSGSVASGAPGSPVVYVMSPTPRRLSARTHEGHGRDRANPPSLRSRTTTTRVGQARRSTFQAASISAWMLGRPHGLVLRLRPAASTLEPDSSTAPCRKVSVLFCAWATAWATASSILSFARSRA